MAHNTRIRTPGGWTGDLLPTEMEQFDLLQHRAMSKRGGAWAPSSQIEIAGSQGLEITGPSRFDNVIQLELASGVAVELSDLIVEREHLTATGRGYGFEMRQLTYSLGFLSGFPAGDLDVPTLVQTEAAESPSFTPRWWIPLSLPVGSVITSLSMTLSADYSEHLLDGALPRSMPRLAMVQAAHDVRVLGDPTMAFDTSTTMTAYQTTHDVVLTTFPASTFDGTEIWWAVIDGEYGENAATGLAITSVRTVSTPVSHDEFLI